MAQLKAHEWLEQHDWIQRQSFKPKNTDMDKATGACIQGALRICYGDNWCEKDAELFKYIQTISKSGTPGTVVNYNDYILTSKEEAVALLKAANL